MRVFLLCCSLLLVTSTFALSQGSSSPKASASPANSATNSPAVINNYSAEPIVIEQIDHSYIMAADGTGVREYTLAARIQSDASVRQLGVLNLQFASSSEHVELVYLRVRRPDNSVTETPVSEAIEMPTQVTTAAPFYSDQKEMQIPVRNLRVGDLLEWKAKFVRTKAEAPGQFWGQESFVTNAVVLAQTFELHLPNDAYVKVWSPAHKPVESTTGSEHIYRWQYSQLKPTVGPEADAEKERKKKTPLTAEEELEQKEGTYPDVAWSTFKSWQAVGDWYESLEAGRTVPDAEIKAKVAELIAGKTTEEEKVRAIYAYVSTQIRYIGVAFGIGRYQPHHALEVLENQYGDCKDKHTLLAAMLEAIGLHPDAVLIGAGIRFNPALPSPADFNHLITHLTLGGKAVWLDATAEVAPYQVLNYAIRDKDALVIPSLHTGPGAATAAIERTPVSLPFPAVQKMDAVGTLENTGTSNSRLVLTLRGDGELFARSAFHQLSPGQYDQMVQQLSQGMGYGGTTTHAEVSRPEDTAEPLKISYDYKRDKAGDWDNLRIIPQITPIDLPRPDDKDPPIESINLGPVRTEISTAAMKLPKGWGAELPEAVHLKSPYATYDETYRFEDGTIFTERKIEVLKEKVPLVDWKTYKKFADQADLGKETYIQLNGNGDKGSTKTASASHSGAGIGSTRNNPPASSDSPHLQDSTKLMQAAASALQRHDFDEARSLLDDAKQNSPDQPNLWATYGFLELARFQLPTAVEDFQKEIALHPGTYQVYSPMARAQRMLNQRKEAKETLQKWADLQPDSPQPTIQLAGMLLQDEDPAAAETAAEDGIARLPDEQKNNAALQLLLGRAQMQSGQKEKGRATLLALLKTTDDPNTMNDSAYELADAGFELPAAESAARKALTRMAEQSKTWTLDENPLMLRSRTNYIVATWDTLGWILFREGHLDQAEEYIHAAWMYQPSAETGQHLAEIALAGGHKQQALEDYELALAAMPTHDAMGVRTVPGARQKKLSGQADALRGQGVRSIFQPASEQEHTALLNLRTVPLGAAAGLNGVAEFRLLLAQGKVIKAARTLESDPAFKNHPEAQDHLLKANLSAFFPKDSDTLLVRTAVLNCHATVCELVFIP